MTVRPAKFGEGWWQQVPHDDDLCAFCHASGQANGDVHTYYLTEWVPEFKANRFRAGFCSLSCLLKWAVYVNALQVTEGKGWQPLEPEHPCRDCGKLFAEHPTATCELWA